MIYNKCMNVYILYMYVILSQRFHCIVHVQHDHQANSLSDPLANHVPPCSRFQRWLVSIVFSGAAVCEICWQIFIQCQKDWVVKLQTYWFSPRFLGKIDSNLTIDFKIFQKGWNHHLEKYRNFSQPGASNDDANARKSGNSEKGPQKHARNRKKIKRPKRSKNQNA